MSDTKPSPKRSTRVTVLLGMACVVLAAATLAGRLGRFWWVMDLCSHFAVYLAVGSAGLCVAAVLLRRWVWAGLAVGVLAVNGVLILPIFTSVAASAPEGSAVLTLAEVNVLHMNRDRTRVGDYLRRCGADIVVVQEVEPWWDTALREMDIPYRVAESRPGQGSFGIALLVHQSLGDDATITLQSTRVFDFADGFVGEERPAIQATLSLSGQRVRLLSVHPPPPVSARHAALRDSILRRAKKWADEQTDPHIVIGDLNTTPWSYAFSILTGDGKLISTLDGRGNQGTWPTHLPMPWLLPIDHCLVSEEWACLDRRIGQATGSDHLPLMVTLAIEPASSDDTPGTVSDRSGSPGEDIPAQPATIHR